MTSAPAVCKFAAEGFVLGLRVREVGRVVEAELVPARGALGLVPSGGAGRTDQDALRVRRPWSVR